VLRGHREATGPHHPEGVIDASSGDPRASRNSAAGGMHPAATVLSFLRQSQGLRYNCVQVDATI
jgi:hypothetical protein